MLRKYLSLVLTLCLVLTSGIFAQTDGAIITTGMSAELLKLVNAAVFEVVVEKPQTDSLVYDRELDWGMVPYATRIDKYESIGTAFAISSTELITAFHVIDLGEESMIYDRYFIRDSGSKVYELDQINAGSNERDFLIFTVKGRTFTDYFGFEEHFEMTLLQRNE